MQDKDGLHKAACVMLKNDPIVLQAPPTPDVSAGDLETSPSTAFQASFVFSWRPQSDSGSQQQEAAATRLLGYAQRSQTPAPAAAPAKLPQPRPKSKRSATAKPRGGQSAKKARTQQPLPDSPGDAPRSAVAEDGPSTSAAATPVLNSLQTQATLVRPAPSLPPPAPPSQPPPPPLPDASAAPSQLVTSLASAAAAATGFHAPVSDQEAFLSPAALRAESTCGAAVPAAGCQGCVGGAPMAWAPPHAYGLPILPCPYSAGGAASALPLPPVRAPMPAPYCHGPALTTPLAYHPAACASSPSLPPTPAAPAVDLPSPFASPCALDAGVLHCASPAADPPLPPADAAGSGFLLEGFLTDDEVTDAVACLFEQWSGPQLDEEAAAITGFSLEAWKPATGELLPLV
ncbi:hypothetical protein HYH03_005427 [Edaphochlamys debaryana]|uniref:Uncharacterized protein n=1 Tax=Edaphochlamys debaryana TaxID=47281 RepID=A0A835Y5W9_9CHLO|nr:hypothetical protein HYH03_005427 [Edaphochlamys debaryana]|eukprot:KAG2496606.1 hypothetical protein HYH03_005427 [Edaphochlamys debaryana]